MRSSVPAYVDASQLERGSDREKDSLVGNDSARDDIGRHTLEPHRTRTNRMPSARRLLLTLLLSLLVTLGIASVATPAARGWLRHSCSRDGATRTTLTTESTPAEPSSQRSGAGTEEAPTPFAALLESAAPDVLHELLHKYFPDRFKHGVWNSEQAALEAVHKDDAELATSLAKLARRDNATSNSPPPTSSASASGSGDSTSGSGGSTGGSSDGGSSSSSSSGGGSTSGSSDSGSGGVTTTTATGGPSTTTTTTTSAPPPPTSGGDTDTSTPPPLSSPSTPPASSASSPPVTSAGTSTSAPIPSTTSQSSPSPSPPPSSPPAPTSVPTSPVVPSSPSSRPATGTTPGLTSETGGGSPTSATSGPVTTSAPELPTSSTSHSRTPVTRTFTSTNSAGGLVIVTQTSYISPDATDTASPGKAKPSGSLQNSAPSAYGDVLRAAGVGIVLLCGIVLV
ncbi:hypothetical protein VTK73DRAFT_3835 [Phialemonium thermophilum]|uniref:Uncharacterized protein n=1 Tax=Phialemonium thermophilum TaxID=223376 RepID=A0ABR3WXT7_9PEZI